MLEENGALQALMDTLLPGGEGFPSASETGMGPLLMARLRTADSLLPQQLVAAITAQGNPPDNADAWCEAARRLEAVEPKLFDTLRKYAYLTYYEQPKTIEAIRTTGLCYNTSPLPGGYATEPFDPACDAPRHQRGYWIATDDVKPLDISHLGLESLS